jgi:hypothetical protein
MKNPYEDYSDKELCEVIEDIFQSKREGRRVESLVPYAEEIKENINGSFEEITLREAIGLAKQDFYDVICNRFLMEQKISEIIDRCYDLCADEKIEVSGFGKNGDLTLHIEKDTEYNPEPAEDEYDFNVVFISTEQNGEIVDDSSDIHVCDLYEQLERIYNYKNFSTL